MKRFIETKFFLLMQDASKASSDAQSLAKAYDGFAGFLFTETTTAGDKAVFCQTLYYTQVELFDLYCQQVNVLKKKCVCNTVFKEIY